MLSQMSPAPDVLANECGASPRAPASSRDEAKKLTVPVSMSAVAVARKVSTNENAAACFGRHISNRPTASPFNKFFGTDVQVARPPLTRAAELHTCIHFFLRIMHLTECEDCHVCKQSVRQWTSHLVAQHTLPSEWPSERASRLPADSVQTPYTYVTESRKKRKPGTIPRPLNSFMLFAQHIRRNILQTFDGVSNVDLSRHLGELWSTLPQTLKTQFDEESARLSRLHQLEFPNYKYQPNKRVQTVISATVVRSLSGSGGLDKPTRINLPPLTIKKATSTLPDSAYVSSGELSPSPYLSDPPPVAASPKKHPVIRSCYSTAPKRPPTSDCGDCGFDEFCTSPQPPPRQRFMSAGNGAPSTMYQRPPLRSASCYPLPRSECLSKAWQPSPASRRETMVPVLVVRGSNVEEFSMTIPLEEEKEATRIETSAMPAVMSSQEEFVLRPPKTEMLKDNNGEEEEQEEEGRDLKPAFWTDSVKQTEWPFVGDAHLLPIETAKEEVEEEDEGPLNLDSLLDGIDISQLISQSVDEMLTSIGPECYQREELTTDVGSNSFLQLTASPLSELLTADRDSFDFCQALLSDGGTPSPVLA